MAPATHATLAVLDVMNTIFPDIDSGVTTEPQFDNGIQVEWFNRSLSDSSSCLEAQSTDHAFFNQQSGHSKTTWTEYNARRSKTNPEVTSVVYMPIIQKPAHELDTLNTVVKRTMHVASPFGQKHMS